MVSFTVAQAGIEQEDIVFGAEATLVKYESAIKIPIPFMDKSYKLGISIAWNTRGSFEAGKMDSNSMHHLVLMEVYGDLV